MEKLKTEHTPERAFTWNDQPISRRAFFNRIGAAGMGMAAASVFGGAVLSGCGGGSGGSGLINGGNGGGGGNAGGPFAGIPGANVNVQAVNYALSLEFLEADLYRQALNKASGRPLTQALDRPAPPSGSRGNYRPSGNISSGGLSQAEFNAGFLYLVQFAYVEEAHANFLKNALGGAAVQPKTYAFPGGPGNDLNAILKNVLTLEETGVRAYLGAVPFITDPATAQTAGTIYSTEARHSAAVSYIVNDGDPGPNRMAGDKEVTPNPPGEKTFEKFLDPQTVLNAIKPFIVA